MNPKEKFSRPPLARMMRIHQALSEGVFPNCTALAAEFEVTTKTIQRDIDFMRDQMALPIEYDARKFGFYYSEPVAGLPTMQVSEGELLALFVAQKALAQYQGTAFAAPLRTAFDKMAQGMKDHVMVQTSDWESFFSFRAAGVPQGDLQLFETLSRTVVHAREITFEYRKLGVQGWESRTVEPHHVVCMDNQWYLFAHDPLRGAARTFSFSRMRNARETGKSFRRRADLSPGRLLEGSFGIYSGKGRHEIRILFDAWAARLVEERMWHPSQKLHHRRDGRLELKMTLASLPEVERWILSWGAHAEVAGPPELRRSVAASVEALAGTYGTAGKRRRPGRAPKEGRPEIRTEA
jgi:proteasome accessory factor B